MHGGFLMQLRDIRETDDGFSYLVDAIDDTLQTIASAGAEDGINCRVGQGFVQILQAFGIRSGKASAGATTMATFGYRKTK